MPITVYSPYGVAVEVEGDVVPPDSELDFMFNSIAKKAPPGTHTIVTRVLDYSSPEPPPSVPASGVDLSPTGPLSKITTQQKLQEADPLGARLENNSSLTAALPGLMLAPLVDIPKLDAGAASPVTRGILTAIAPNQPPEVTASEINAATGLASGMTSPVGLITLGAAPAAGALGRAAIGAGFAVPMGVEAVKQAGEAGRLSVEGTPQQAADALAGSISGAVMAGAIGGGVSTDLRANPIVPGGKSIPNLLRRDSGIMDLKVAPIVENLKAADAPATAAVVEQIKPEEPNAIQIKSPNEEVLRNEQPQVGLPEVGKGNAPQEVAPAAQAQEVAAEPVGMGAAKYGELDPAKSVTSIKNEVVDQQRADMGLPPVVQPLKRAFGEVWDQAMSIVDNDPTRQDRLIAELKDKPRAITDTEDALLLQRQVELQNEFGRATKDLNQAYEDGRIEDLARERERVDHLSDKLLELYDVNKTSGTETARGLNARKMLANEDFSLAAMEVQSRAAKGGRPLTLEEHQTIADLNKKILETQKAFDEYRANVEAQKAKKEAGTAIEETVARVKNEKPVERDLAAEQQNIIGGITKAQKEGVLFGDMTRFVQKLAENFVRQGIVERDKLIDAVHEVLSGIMPDITRRDTMDAISGYGQFKPLNPDEIKAKLRDLKGQMQQIGKLEDMQAGQAPAKTGIERRVPSQEERNLIKLVNEAKKKGGFDVTDPAKQLKSALDAIKTRLKNQIADLEFQIATKEKIVDRKNPTPRDDEALQLEARRDELKKQFDEIFPKQDITPEERVRRAIAAVERSAADLELRIKNNDIGPRSRVSKTPNTPELEAARARRDALKEQLQELRDIANPKKTPEERALQNYKTRTANQIADYYERLANQDFVKGKKPPLDISNDPEAIKLKTEHELAKREFEHYKEEDRLARRTTTEKVYAGFKEALNFPRNILSSWDVSAVLRQGGMISFAHPERAGKALGPMFKSLLSPEAAARIEQQILSRPNAPLYARSKLYLAPRDSVRLSAQEEQMMSRLATRIPKTVVGTLLLKPIHASNRAFISFLNLIRADSFDAMVKSVERGKPLGQTELNAIANYINVATGRGNMYKAAASAEFLATVFFSPRLMLSRFQLLVGQPLYHGTMRTRMAVAKEYGLALMGIGTVIGLGVLSGATLETDPRSSDFGKLKFGNTRVDPLAGLAQWTTLLSRLGSGETKTLGGKVKPIVGDVPYGSATAPDVIGRFLRTKLSPVLSSAIDLRTGENVVGEKVTPGDVATRALVPLSFQDIQKIMEEHGVQGATALEILQLFGMGVQQFDDKKK